MATTGREWPPAYDREELVATIRSAAEAAAGQFYLPTITDPEPCQGDVVELAADVPVIDSEGQASIDGSVTHWLIITNTCDMARDVADVEYVAIVPLTPIDENLEMDDDVRRDLRRYSTSRMFLIPPWANGQTEHFADFTRVVSLHRTALRTEAEIQGRMTIETWILLNACLVRLLCREDRREL